MDQLQEKIVMVTGATSGIGQVTARELARRGATVVIVGRNPAKCQRTVEDIQKATGNPRVRYLVADLALMREVRDLAREFLTEYPRLDILVNNAGAIFPQRTVTKEGLEQTWALNHLSYFLLTHQLMPALLAAPTARVINVSSDAHFAARGVHIEDPMFERRRYSAFAAYSQSKLANVMFTAALARRLRNTTITANALHPGAVATNFGIGHGGIVSALFKLARPFMLTPEQGAQTTIYLATSDAVQHTSGAYFDRCKTKPPSPAARDVNAQEQLWALSEQHIMRVSL